MSQYILDSDVLTLFQHNHPAVVRRVRANYQNIAITIVTAQEQMRGRMAGVNRALQSYQTDKVVLAYNNLSETLNDLKRLEIVDLNQEASDRYLELRQQKIRIGTLDLLIACIVLSQNGILVTRNRRDFARVPGLIFEDWTVESGI